VNPKSNKFEQLRKADWAEQQEKMLSEQLRQITAAQEELVRGSHQLVRPNGEPVPKHWAVFTVGERVVLKDYTFEVVDISEDRILFKPMGLAIGEADGPGACSHCGAKLIKLPNPAGWGWYCSAQCQCRGAVEEGDTP